MELDYDFARVTACFPECSILIETGSVDVVLKETADGGYDTPTRNQSVTTALITAPQLTAPVASMYPA